jgi:hypothetical protein
MNESKNLSSIEHNKQTERISFNVYQSNGQKKAGLKRSFLVVCMVHVNDVSTGRITLDTDGIVWKLHAEQAVIQAMKQSEVVKCIVSFQTFVDGDSFAIARLYRNKDKPTKG